MDAEKLKKVTEQYIDQYKSVIMSTLKGLRANTNLYIPHAQFLFAIIDYYGMLFMVAKNGIFDKRKKDNFVKFFESDYFPPRLRCKASFLYFIRNGIIHQIFPKACGINSTACEDLFYEDAKHKIPVLNLFILQDITLVAIQNFVSDINQNDTFVENIHRILILDCNNYGLGDHKELEEEINKNFNGKMINLYKACGSFV
ncbi:MAG TPA: hypothetical protein VN721_00250 [Flavipsychrobacter sp.]|nr:hypothetical protein [Flavipsychrobacter sp.]